jgi:hypothetical protein
MRSALRQASENLTIRRRRHTTRGIENLVELVLLRIVGRTYASTFYEIRACLEIKQGPGDLTNG